MKKEVRVAEKLVNWKLIGQSENSEQQTTTFEISKLQCCQLLVNKGIKTIGNLERDYHPGPHDLLNPEDKSYKIQS